MGEKPSKGYSLNPRTPLAALHCAALVTSVASECPDKVSVTQVNVASDIGDTMLLVARDRSLPSKGAHIGWAGTEISLVCVYYTINAVSGIIAHRRRRGIRINRYNKCLVFIIPCAQNWYNRPSP